MVVSARGPSPQRTRSRHSSGSWFFVLYRRRRQQPHCCDLSRAVMWRVNCSDCSFARSLSFNSTKVRALSMRIYLACRCVGLKFSMIMRTRVVMMVVLCVSAVGNMHILIVDRVVP
ncbi:hypothetical protein CC80DRAFT_40400 [Byssothecium circinans]|uniref:Uncharacterized protein n=1 Tax=Byssothecium circinans TaxID=147558 RepID=A0A6A5U0E9_9PLEO|nr:hypothetical protein CC80DRAFT_40400 [Byssothecium circinans]